MKAISVRQPWAWLIIHGGKDIENRTWKTKYRGQVFIHAGKKIDMEAYNELLEEGIALPPINQLETGGIVGSAEIVGCVDAHKSGWFRGPYGFVLKNQKPITFYPCPGRLYFFEPAFGHTSRPCGSSLRCLPA